VCPGNTHRLRWGALGDPETDADAHHLGTVLGQLLGADLPEQATGEFQTRGSRRIATALFRLLYILQGVFAEGRDHTPARRHELAFLDGLLEGILTELNLLARYNCVRRPILPLVDELADTDDE
jgi:hypothetical protein